MQDLDIFDDDYFDLCLESSDDTLKDSYFKWNRKTSKNDLSLAGKLYLRKHPEENNRIQEKLAKLDLYNEIGNFLNDESSDFENTPRGKVLFDKYRQLMKMMEEDKSDSFSEIDRQFLAAEEKALKAAEEYAVKKAISKYGIDALVEYQNDRYRGYKTKQVNRNTVVNALISEWKCHTYV